MSSSVPYLQCDVCNQIEKASKWVQTPTKLLKCIHCDSAGEEIAWPPKEVLAVLTFISTYDHKSPEYGQVTSVFLSSVLELFLEELLYTMAYFDFEYNEAGILVDALIDGYQGRNRMFALYKRIGYGSFHEVVNNLGMSNFIKHWDEIVEVRNKVVHGKLDEAEKITPQTINTTIEEALVVFSQLQNIYNQETLRYKAVTKRKNEMESDLEKLKKWASDNIQEIQSGDIEQI